MNEFNMFRLKILKTNKIPRHFIVKHESSWAKLTYHDGRWKTNETGFDFLFDVVHHLKSNELNWLFGSDLKKWFWSNEVYKAIESGGLTLPTLVTKDGHIYYSGMLIVDDPFILDIKILRKKIKCIDFANFGIMRQSNLCEAIDRLKDLVYMIVKFNMGTLSVTAASQGCKRLKTYDLGELPVYCHFDPGVRMLEREAYYAGRSEVLQLGRVNDHVPLVTKELYDLDVNSQYATIGLTKEFPTRLIDKGVGNTDMSDGHFIAAVDIFTDEPWYPVRRNGIVIYPIGKFHTTLCWPELKIAIDNGHLLKIHRWARYATSKIFRKNSEWFFHCKQLLKEYGMDHMSDCFKLCQNSLYGNIGKRGRQWEAKDKIGSEKWQKYWHYKKEIQEVVRCRAINDVHQWLNIGDEPKTSIPSISATMCSYGRVNLLSLVTKAGWNHTYYLDTDGLLVDAIGKKRLSLKKWNLKIRGCDHDAKWNNKSTHIYAIKDYRFGDIWRQAGIPLDIKRDEDGNGIIEEGSDYDPYIEIIKLRKINIFQKYQHGKVDKHGRVTPLEIYE